MDCPKFQENLYLYLDRQIEEGLKQEMDQHRLNCPICSLEFEKEKKFGHLLKTHIIKEKAPYALREAVVKNLEINNQKFRWSHILKKQFAPVFVILAIIIASVFYQQFNSRDIFPVFNETVKNHLEYLKGSYPLEFETVDIKTALNWFEGKTDFSVTSPHIVLDKVQLIGGRIVNIKDKKSAYFVFEKDGYKISAFNADLHDVIRPKASKKEGIKAFHGRLVKTEKGYHTIYCYHREDGTACILVSDMPLEQLEKLIV